MTESNVTSPSAYKNLYFAAVAIHTVAQNGAIKRIYPFFSSRTHSDRTANPSHFSFDCYFTSRLSRNAQVQHDPRRVTHYLRWPLRECLWHFNIRSVFFSSVSQREKQTIWSREIHMKVISCWIFFFLLFIIRETYFVVTQRKLKTKSV